MLQGKTVILGVTGGIAAYKAAAVASKLTQAGADVRVVMTASATKFVAPLTFQAITRHRVVVDTFDEEDAAVISHIDLADRADAVVVAPATANALAKLALGLGDDMLSTTLLAHRGRTPVLIAPAMNVHMYANPIVQQHMETLRGRGVHFVEPGEGFLACGYTGKGRMAEPEQIADKLSALLAAPRDLDGVRVLVTAGATVERIDPVRYLTNDSSGKMGFAVAEAARARGARVTLVAGRADAQPPAGVELVRVESAQDMYDAVLARFPETDIVVKAAAVADYRPAARADRKLKKSADEMTLTLERTPDILKELGARKRPDQVLIGFAAETHDVAQYAVLKAASKRADFIVANDVSQPGVGFGHDTNAVSVFTADGLVEELPLQSKRSVADRLLTIGREAFAARAAAANAGTSTGASAGASGASSASEARETST
ncbi:bifunctional phosphopantothenoylcysteine decarboxylase/phosphopantothenate--cysteine ligase CoaBC [Paenibacillus sp.]|uniref:bifunctional phosphopantothenoylcysteine decarboxylase/phosphopantothenate--cysteine ligase CoaBC n=1 Tax=Paenibacillus sp. TaxID=58172 RepID=UPI002D3702A6|nr:bifunctional phosphopantothenoylcysteine decarboxylase/phosphopantothenate--cysteine ligase CoaBC [Paenibacillus sp.]HZG84479.1 bifunctional phosphopantothenoylcysteine decarboxylase/phosphopantothenate--cysteine ligase CoaBC [Paenibacillus sp.]